MSWREEVVTTWACDVCAVEATGEELPNGWLHSIDGRHSCPRCRRELSPDVWPGAELDPIDYATPATAGMTLLANVHDAYALTLQALAEEHEGAVNLGVRALAEAVEELGELVASW